MKYLLKLSAILFLTTGLISAQNYDRAGSSLVLPEQPGKDWVFVGDPMRGFDLMDARTNAYLARMVTYVFSGTVESSLDKKTYYFPGNYYSRGLIGELTTTLNFYDSTTLAITDEVIIPNKVHGVLTAKGATSMTDDGRFMVVFNLTPASSVSIVDLQNKTFVGEISTPGCSLTYAAGDRKFLMPCSDGAFMMVTLDDEGKEASRERTNKIFNPDVDPLSVKPVRNDDEILFLSYGGVIQPVDISRGSPRFGNTWSLFDGIETADQWMTAGTQEMSLHQDSETLYVLMHRKGPHTQSDPNVRGGHEIWVYDLDKKQRIRVIPVPNTEPDRMRESLHLNDGSFLGDLIEDYVQKDLPHYGAKYIEITQGDDPLILLVSANHIADVAVVDADSGEFLHRLEGIESATYVTQP